jgi:rhodanese-related sulfurtransferase
MRHLLKLLLLAFLFSSTLVAAQSPGTVSVAQLQTALADQTVQLVDVRTPQEWSTGHIPGAMHLDWFDDDFKARVSQLNKDKPVRLYCAGGGRSEEARQMLREMGFTDVYDLDGGIAAWKKAGGRIVK